jgi:hypothetical protein
LGFNHEPDVLRLERKSATKKQGKPHGVHDAEIRWALTKSDFDTVSPFTLKSDEADWGKRIYFCLRWESNTNLKGPLGEIYSAVIP